MKGQTSVWIDSTIADRNTFKPIYHSSYNAQRNMVLNFKNPVTGYYLDKASVAKKEINQITISPYFDSNLYPLIIQTLPLASGYTSVIPIFDYNPKTKTGELKAYVSSVTQSEFKQ
jgi:hypothetical protein